MLKGVCSTGFAKHMLQRHFVIVSLSFDDSECFSTSPVLLETGGPFSEVVAVSALTRQERLIHPPAMRLIRVTVAMLELGRRALWLSSDDGVKSFHEELRA